MSQQPPSTYPQQPVPPYGQRAEKYRPRVLWFFVGGALLLVSLIVFIGALLVALKPLFHEDAVFPASTRHTLRLPAHTERALYTKADGLSCLATDGSGTPLTLRQVSGSFTINDWVAVARFDTGDGRVTLDCAQSDPSADVRVGQLPSTGTFLTAVVIGILVPLVLGVTGVIMLIVTTVLFLTRPARPRPAT